MRQRNIVVHEFVRMAANMTNPEVLELMPS